MFPEDTYPRESSMELVDTCLEVPCFYLCATRHMVVYVQISSRRTISPACSFGMFMC